MSDISRNVSLFQNLDDANIVTITDNYTVANNIGVVLADCSSKNIIITLPTAITCPKRRMVLKKTDNSAYTATVTAFTGQTIDGASTYVLEYIYEFVELVSNGTSWYVLSE